VVAVRQGWEQIDHFDLKTPNSKSYHAVFIFCCESVLTR
jgi:hypothetical protein